MIIRRAAAEDLPDILLLYGQLNPEDDYRNRESFEKIWLQILTDEKIYCLIGWEGKRAVSSCTLTVIPNLTRGRSPYGIIENVITHRDYRKRGFGEAIMNEAVSIAKDKRCYKVMLMSSAKRVEAHGFYEKIGFDGNSKKGFQLRLC